MQAKSSRTSRIDIRTTLQVKRTLQEAAAIRHKTVTEFLIEHGLQAAAQTLADRRRFEIGEEQWQAFQQALDRPPQRLPRLERLIKTPGALD